MESLVAALRGGNVLFVELFCGWSVSVRDGALLEGKKKFILVWNVVVLCVDDFSPLCLGECFDVFVPLLFVNSGIDSSFFLRKRRHFYFLVCAPKLL